MLAGLAHAPSADNPLVSPRRARARRALALARMRGAGVATDADVALALQEPVLVAASARRFLAPHFTTYFLAATRRHDLARRHDAQNDAALRTSLDYALQRDVELEVHRTVLDLRERGVEQAAAVVLDNRTGEVLAWVGSPDFWADTAGQTDMVVSPRQPGSALKPFLYGLAFDRGFTPASILADIPHTYQTSTGPYHPRNYDRRYHGPVRARDALGSSYNIPAIELTQQLGAGSLLQTLHLAGFASLRESADYYGLGPRTRQRRRIAPRARERLSRDRQPRVWRPIATRARDGARRWRNDALASRDDSDVRRARARHPRGSRGPRARLRHRVRARVSIRRRGEDGHEPSLHRQLGRRDDGGIHRRRVGGQLQRPPDGWRERRDRRGPAHASRRDAHRRALRAGRASVAGEQPARSRPMSACSRDFSRPMAVPRAPSGSRRAPRPRRTTTGIAAVAITLPRSTPSGEARVATRCSLPRGDSSARAVAAIARRRRARAALSHQLTTGRRSLRGASRRRCALRDDRASRGGRGRASRCAGSSTAARQVRAACRSSRARTSFARAPLRALSDEVHVTIER